MNNKRPKSAAPVLGAGKRERASIPFRRTKENAMAFRPRSATSPEAVAGRRRVALQQQSPSIANSEYRDRIIHSNLGSENEDNTRMNADMGGFKHINASQEEPVRPKTANVVSPTRDSGPSKDINPRPASAYAVSKRNLVSKPSRPSVASWRRAYSPNQSRFVRPASSSSRPKSSSRSRRIITKGSLPPGAAVYSSAQPPSAASVVYEYPFGEPIYRVNQLASTPGDDCNGTLPPGPIGMAAHETGIPPWLVEAKQFFHRRYLQATMQETKSRQNENGYHWAKKAASDATTIEEWNYQAQKLVQQAELLWRGNIYLAKELEKENSERVARVARDKDVEEELQKELHRIKAELGMAQGSLDQMRDIAAKASAKETRATQKMEKTRAIHDRLLRRLMYSGLDMEKVLQIGPQDNHDPANVQLNAAILPISSDGQAHSARGGRRYLTSAKVKAASNLVRRENQNLKKENKQLRKELRAAEIIRKRLLTRLHINEGKAGGSIGDTTEANVAGKGLIKPVRSRSISNQEYALMGGMHTNVRSRPASGGVQPVPKLRKMSEDSIGVGIIPDAESWLGQEFDIKGSSKYENDTYDEEYEEDFEEVDNVKIMGFFDGNEEHQQEVSPMALELETLDGGSGNIANLTAIAQFLAHIGLGEFTSAIVRILGGTGCLEDLYDPRCLSDQKLLVIGMNESQIRTFREAVAKENGSEGRSTLPDEYPDEFEFDNGKYDEEKDGHEIVGKNDVGDLKARITELESILQRKLAPSVQNPRESTQHHTILGVSHLFIGKVLEAAKQHSCSSLEISKNCTSKAFDVAAFSTKTNIAPVDQVRETAQTKKLTTRTTNSVVNTNIDMWDNDTSSCLDSTRSAATNAAEAKENTDKEGEEKVDHRQSK